jgi:hypothetical protein
MFEDLQSPYIRTLYLTDNPIPSNEEMESPFYAVGRATAAFGNSAQVQIAFLKVWNVEDVRWASVESEWMHHQRAFEAGVSPRILRLTSTCGSEYFV